MLINNKVVPARATHKWECNGIVEFYIIDGEKRLKFYDGRGWVNSFYDCDSILKIPGKFESIKAIKDKSPSLEDWDNRYPNITKPRSKYHKVIKGVEIDVYDVLHAYGVTNQADAHAIKKLLMAGQRGYKDANQDRCEAIAAIERAIELESGDK